MGVRFGYRVAPPVKASDVRKPVLQKSEHPVRELWPFVGAHRIRLPVAMHRIVLQPCPGQALAAAAWTFGSITWLLPGVPSGSGSGPATAPLQFPALRRDL